MHFFGAILGIIPLGMTLTHCFAAYRCDLMPARNAAAAFFLCWLSCFVAAGCVRGFGLAAQLRHAPRFRVSDDVRNRYPDVSDPVGAA